MPQHVRNEGTPKLCSMAFTRSNRSKQWLLFKAFANAAAFAVETVFPFLTNTRHSSPTQNITFGSFHAPISMLSTESCRADVAQASVRRHLLLPAVHERHHPGIGTKLLCPSRHIDTTGTIPKPHVNAHQTSYLAAEIKLVRGSVKIKKLVGKRNTEAGDDHTIRHMQHSHACVRLQSLIQRCHTSLRYRVPPLNTHKVTHKRITNKGTINTPDTQHPPGQVQSRRC